MSAIDDAREAEVRAKLGEMTGAAIRLAAFEAYVRALADTAAEATCRVMDGSLSDVDSAGRVAAVRSAGYELLGRLGVDVAAAVAAEQGGK